MVLLGLETGKHGFPSQKTTHPLLEALLPAQEDFLMLRSVGCFMWPLPGQDSVLI
ncbi:hypothetical protein P4133_22110 [Pseudomonas aeruginosa]|nr:hypothetical protein [Pseudomonas aeruginosa]